MRNEGLGYVSGVFSSIGEILGRKEWVVVECLANDFQIENGNRHRQGRNSGYGSDFADRQRRYQLAAGTIQSEGQTTAARPRYQPGCFL